MTPERLDAARKVWTEGNAADFEVMGKRRWRDRATSVEYRLAPGQPLYSARGPQPEDVDVFVVQGGRFRLMRRADREEGTTVHVGVVSGGRARVDERALGLGL